MRFQNGKNGYIEEKTVPWLWTILFGGIYFLANGLWAGFFIWLLIGTFLYASMGPPATLLMIVLGLIMSAFAPSMIKASYLRRGWTQIDDDSTVENINQSASKAGNSKNFAAFDGIRDLSSAPYQLFLIKRYAIEKNSVLEKFVVGEEIFSTLEEALKHASHKYEKEFYANLEVQSSSVETPLFANKKSEMKKDVMAIVWVAVAIGGALLLSTSWHSSENDGASISSIASADEAAKQSDAAYQEITRIKEACGADAESMKLWLATHKTGWADHMEEVGKCMKKHK